VVAYCYVKNFIGFVQLNDKNDKHYMNIDSIE